MIPKSNKTACILVKKSLRLPGRSVLVAQHEYLEKGKREQKRLRACFCPCRHEAERIVVAAFGRVQQHSEVKVFQRQIELLCPHPRRQRHRQVEPRQHGSDGIVELALRFRTRWRAVANPDRRGVAQRARRRKQSQEPGARGGGKHPKRHARRQRENRQPALHAGHAPGFGALGVV